MGIFTSKKAKRRKKAEKKRYQNYMKRSRKGDTMKLKSPYSKEQNKLVKWLSKEVTGKMGGELDIKKDPLYQAGGAKLQQLLSGDPAASEAFAAPMRRQFNEQIMPEIAEQYAGAGAGRSSAFRSAAATAGSTLAENIGAMREQMSQQAISQALGYAQQPITNRSGLMGQVIGQQPSQIYEEPYMTDFKPDAGYGGPILGTAGAAAGAYFGGAPGAAAGWQAGQSLGNMLTSDGAAPAQSGARPIGQAAGQAGGRSLADWLDSGQGGAQQPMYQRNIGASEVPKFEQTMAVS